jgi:GTP-binding protein
LNFFQLGSAVYLVDLPGYGYAKAPIGAIEAWLALIESYLTNRTTLKRVYVLVDSRHGLKDSDVQMLTFLTALGQSHQIILTKTDKISKKALEDLRLEVEQRSIQFPALHPEVHAVSALKKDGVQTLQQAISALINLG